MSETKNEYMKTLKQIRELGFRRIEVEFSGGNDSGGADAIRAYWSNPKKGEPLNLDPYKSTPALDKLGLDQKAVSDLITKLLQPINDRWGSFAGDFSVSGQLYWDADELEVAFDASEGETVYRDIDTKLFEVS